MARKNREAFVPAQMGFGFEICDAQGNRPGFLYERDEVYAALDEIQQAAWVSTDVETTGLTDASMPVQLDPALRKQDASSVVRLRTIQARIPTIRGRSGPRRNYAFDCDRMGPKLTREVAAAILSRKLFIAHNAGFDLYWLRRADGRRTMPAMVLDSMLLTRLLQPKLVLRRAELMRDIQHRDEVAFADPVAQAAWQSIISGASGGSLADVILAMFETVVDKSLQKPTNWTGLLGFAHYDYAIDDVVWADKIVCRLLDLPEDGDIYQAYLGQRARKATVRLIEPQVPELVLLREHGMPLNTMVGHRYVVQKRAELGRKVTELIELEPALERFRMALADPDAGLDDDLKKALAVAFSARGVVLRKTAATGAAQVGEKDLRACKAAQIEASRPLFNAWVAVCRAKKQSAMALEVCGFAERSEDGYLRSLLSHGPVTGRLAASEPNCFTGDTEILTESGWVRFDQLTNEQRVAQYAHGSISFVRPYAYVREAWQGDLVRNLTPDVDLLTTPKHRCLLLNPHTGIEEVRPASQYAQGMQQLHAAGYVGGAGAPLSDQEIRYLAWMIGGSVATRLVPSDDQRFSAEARAFIASQAQPGQALFAMTRLQLDVFVRELSYWYGQPGDAEQLINYRSTRLDSANWVQIACLLSGKAATLNKEVSAAGEPCWRVRAKLGAFSSTSYNEQSRIPYNGLVYCVSVDSGFIVVRRNGRAVITGQCQQFPRDQLFRAMCMSKVKPGCEYVQVVATEVTAQFLSTVSGTPVVAGDTVTVESAWAAAMFASDKYVPDWPKEERQALGDLIDSQFSHRIVASDFGALDVRVGAALAIRSQREMLALAKGIPVPGEVQPPDAVVEIIRAVCALLDRPDAEALLTAKAERYHQQVLKLEKDLQTLSDELDRRAIQKNLYFKRRREIKDKMLALKLGWRLAQCLALGAARGEQEYSGLRDAFVVDIDIHTFTGMKLVGRDPMKEFQGLSTADRKALEKKLKKELGPRRQQGKIANLSLLYGMADAGFQEAAARGYNEHWSLAEAGEIRALWMNAYPEVELWHLWTECLMVGTVYLPEQGREKPVRSGWWVARTLANREIVAFGLNAALSYQDQSTGADILGLIMHRLYSEYREIFDTIINQVHDECVFSWLAEHHDEYLPIVESVMVEEANSLLMPYGVPAAVSPACGPLWIKD